MPAPLGPEQEQTPSALLPRFPVAPSQLTARAHHLRNPRSCFLKSSKSEWIWPSRKFRINFVEIAEARRQVSCAVEADTRRSQTGDSHPDIRRQPKISCQAASGPFPLLPGWKDGCCPRRACLRDFPSHPTWRDSGARDSCTRASLDQLRVLILEGVGGSPMRPLWNLASGLKVPTEPPCSWGPASTPTPPATQALAGGPASSLILSWSQERQGLEELTQSLPAHPHSLENEGCVRQWVFASRPSLCRPHLDDLRE